MYELEAEGEGARLKSSKRKRGGERRQNNRTSWGETQEVGLSLVKKIHRVRERGQEALRKSARRYLLNETGARAKKVKLKPRVANTKDKGIFQDRAAKAKRAGKNSKKEKKNKR